MSATIEATETRDPLALADAVALLLDNKEIQPLDTLWRYPSGVVFVGPLPEDLTADCDPIGSAAFWYSISLPF